MNFTKLIIKIILITFCLSIVTTGMAQIFDAGVIVGFNNSKNDGIYNKGYYVIGSQLGEFIKISISENSRIKQEVQYINIQR